jgi:beta-glucanase (GH16 family)
MSWRKVARIGVPVLAILLAGGLVAPVEASWSLAWSDEFNGTTLDTGNWSYDIGTGCPSLCGWGNNELQYYRSQNVTVSGGSLVITSRAESYGGASFTSGKVHTRSKRTVLYGRVEMRAKIPTGGGMWPAFWMMPQDDVYGGWAASGELDIMESANGTTTVGGALHYGGTWPSNTSTSGSYSLGGANFASDFHVYAVEWEPDAIRWYVDGALFMTRTSAQWYTNTAPGNARAPFDQPFYIILNTAVGGNYTGCTDPSCVTATLPQQYLVDYVRVYEDIPNALPAVAITAPAWGATLPPGTITITADASDADGSVTTVPYSFTWNSVADGCYEIVARAIDNLGGSNTDVADIAVGAGCGQAPYLGQPSALPTRIEAENYDAGGEGIAYHDQDASNNGGQYRPGEGVDLEPCSDAGGGYNAGWLNVGEWIEYTIHVPVAGDYTLDARVASQSAGGALHFTFNGVDKTGEMTVPVTGGWQNWTTITTMVSLTAGTQTLRVVVDSNGFNFNYLDLLGDFATGVPDPGTTVGHALHPCYPNPFRAATTIRYELTRAEAVHLAIYDVSGRLVKALIRGEQVPAGPQQAAWDGRDENGRAVPTGVYFYRLEAGAFSDTRRVTLIM